MFESSPILKPALHPALTVFFVILLAGLGFIIGGIAGLFLYLPFFDGGEAELFRALQSPQDHPEIKPALMAAQAGASIGGLILAPLIFLRTQRLPAVDLFRGNNIPFFIFLIAAAIIFFSFGINSLFMEWNQEIVFPEFMKGFEEWARERENEAERQTLALTKMISVTDLLLGIIVIAVLPAIGEEFVFRGIIQNELWRGTKNIHVAIWFAAVLFSAIHLQFFGFIPRMILGAIFGYLYYWSASLWVPVVAHFVNNCVQIIALYLYQNGKLDFDIEAPEAVPVNAVMISAVTTAGLLYYFYSFFKGRKIYPQQL